MKLAHTITSLSFIAVCSIFSQSAMASLESSYSEVKNKRHSELCLQTVADKNTVALGNCSTSDNANSEGDAKQWRTVEQPRGFFFIKNQSSDECLRTFNHNDNVTLGACHESEGTIQDHTMRLWTIVSVDQTHVQLQNKYKQDNKKTLCLTVTNDNNRTLTLGSCTNKTTAEDTNKWASEIFRHPEDHAAHDHE
jgi:hypothetical protein